MTVRLLSFRDNDLVAYPSDGITYTYKYKCNGCGITFIADEPQLICPYDKGKNIKQIVDDAEFQGQSPDTVVNDLPTLDVVNSIETKLLQDQPTEIVVTEVATFTTNEVDKAILNSLK